MARDKIAFVSTYEHPSRHSVEKMLAKAFPEYEIDNVSVFDIVKSRKRWRLPNLPHMAKEFGGALLRRALTPTEVYLRTTYVRRKVHAVMHEFIDPARHVFSFQTQSLYDTSLPGVPHFIYTDHTHLSNLSAPDFNRRNLNTPAWIELERSTYQHATRVFTRSHDIEADLRREYHIAPEKIACVYAGSNVSVPESHAPDNAGYSNRRILFVGGDWERKGGPQLLQAFEKVLQVYSDAELIVAGARVDTNLPNCRFLGSVPLAELPKYFTEASVFCVPTRLEPFGIVFIEAMMYKLPIVATRVGALPDMVIEGETGHLVAPGDVDALAQALIGLLGDPDRCRRYGEAGHRHSLARYTWDHVGRRIREHVLPLVT